LVLIPNDVPARLVVVSLATSKPLRTSKDDVWYDNNFLIEYRVQFTLVQLFIVKIDLGAGYEW